MAVLIATMLFIIRMADIDIKIKGCRVCFSAGNAKIMKLIQKPGEINNLQKKVYKLFSWEKINNILFNNNKF